MLLFVYFCPEFQAVVMASPVAEEDLLVPTCIHWSVSDVANWIEELGFPQYRECFSSNLIDGRKLYCVDSR